ncbi:MAG TPA: hypothetical protein VMP11_13025 [Verrucomicrobiae bacterium]|nr:hypothetical protein [Verrucomicrobiae bacterium]
MAAPDQTAMQGGLCMPDATGIIGLTSAASPAMLNKVAIVRLSNTADEIRHDRKRQILM